MPEIKITKQQGKVSYWLQQGLTTKAIGEKLAISQRTVESHIQDMFSRTGMHTRSGIVAELISCGLIPEGPNSSVSIIGAKTSHPCHGCKKLFWRNINSCYLPICRVDSHLAVARCLMTPMLG